MNARPSPRLQVPFALCLALALGALPATAQDLVSDVRLAVSADGRIEARYAVDRGLYVTGWPGAPRRRVELGDAARPRFAPDGSLVFERSTDDGHEVLSTTLWRLRPGHVRPEPWPAGAPAPAYRLPPAGGAPSAAVKVCVDAGHGGTDPGGSGNGLQEKAVNLAVALELRDWLLLDTKDTRGGGSWSVLLTRTGDTTVSLAARTNAANAFGAASFLSVHMNAFSSSAANGTETYCMTGQERNAGGRLRNRVQAEALAAWRLRDRGVKSRSLYVLRNTRMPAALLEGGFVTSPIDAAKMRSAAERKRLALHLLFALQQHHGFSRYEPKGGGGGGTPGTLKGVLYDASRGSGARIAGATVALADGRFAVTNGVGYFEFSLPAGPYTYAATAAGFDPAQTSRSVPAGGVIWGSLGLRPAAVPALSANSTPQRGQSLGLTLRGDRGSPAWLVASTRPGLPLVNLGGLGLGVVWPALSGAAIVELGAIPSTGVLRSGLRAPFTPGRVHLQAIVRHAGRLRLSNGVGVEVR